MSAACEALKSLAPQCNQHRDARGQKPNERNVNINSVTQPSVVVKIVSVGRSPKPSILATAKVELCLPGGDTITIDDLRVLRNRQGALWIAMPAFSVTNGKQYEYFPSVALSTRLKREVEDATLAAFEEWQSHEPIQN
jgi:DNA-binding cell septation regulator SpoVG